MEDVYDRLPFENIDGGPWRQGWVVEHDPEEWKERHLKVYVVPHSHNDPGWIITYRQYFDSKTRGILNSVVNSLSKVRITNSLSTRTREGISFGLKFLFSLCGGRKLLKR